MPGSFGPWGCLLGAVLHDHLLSWTFMALVTCLPCLQPPIPGWFHLHCHIQWHLEGFCLHWCGYLGLDLLEAALLLRLLPLPLLFWLVLNLFLDQLVYGLVLLQCRCQVWHWDCPVHLVHHQEHCHRHQHMVDRSNCQHHQKIVIIRVIVEGIPHPVKG